MVEGVARGLPKETVLEQLGVVTKSATRQRTAQEPTPVVI